MFSFTGDTVLGQIISGTNQNWKVVMEDALTSVNQTEPGIFDVRSGSDKTSLEGTPYAEW